MRYLIVIAGIEESEGGAGLIMHNGEAGLDTRSPANLEKAEITKKRGSNRTLEDDLRLRELECFTSLWLDKDGGPTVPAAALRSVIETAARRLKQGGSVREGLIVEKVIEFDYDRNKLGETAEELAKNVQFTCPVVVQRNRILRTRALFDKWGVSFIVDVDTSLVDLLKLRKWLEIAGKRIGLGDWRPEKSGMHGRFNTISVEAIDKLK